MSRNFRLPFELPVQKFYQVTVSPEVAGIMMAGDEMEREAIELIAENWTQRSTPAPILDPATGVQTIPAPTAIPFGLSIPHCWGFKASERKQLTAASQTDRVKIGEVLKLVKSVATKTGKPVKEIQQAFMQAEQGGLDLELLDGCMDEFLALQDLNKPTPYNDIADTLYMQRVIPSWRTELTIALHPAIRQELTDFGYEESEGADSEKK
jgi:hypothetical protein